VPGATPGVQQNSIQGAPARALSTNINGTNRNSNITRLDGAVNIYLWLPHHTVYVAPAETVDTVSVATNNFDAEQGMAGGAAITVATKSGTNELHGSVFAFHTNHHLKAKNFFFVGNLPRSTRNIDGFTVGGPIKKNKLFFFGGWEGMRERGENSGFYTVSTADQRNGNFSAFNTNLYDPLTGAANGTGRTLFTSATIPTSRISTISSKMQALVPAPNLSGTGANYFNSGAQIFNRDNFDVKADWTRTDRHSLFAKYSAMNATATCAFALGKAGGDALCTGGVPGTAHTLAQISTIGHTWTFSPTFVVDPTIGWTRMTQLGTDADYGTNFGLDTLGLPGTNGPDPRQSGMPAFNVSGYATMGMRFGFDMVRHQLNIWQPELDNPRGAFSFGGGVTALSGGASSNQFNNYATFLLGLPTSMSKSLQTYDPLPFSRPLRGPYPATIVNSYVGANSYSYYQPLALGIPLFSGPDINQGTFPLPPTVSDRSPWGGRLHRGYIQSWNFLVERKLPGDSVASLGYVGDQTVHQLADREINYGYPGSGSTGVPLYAKWGRTASTTMWDGFLSANYHSLQASLNHRFTKGFLVKGAYIFSKAISCTDEDGWAALTWYNPTQLARNRSLTGYDRTHILLFGWVAELPFGPGKKYAHSGPLSLLLRDWALNGTFSSYSGTPFTVGASGTSLNAANSETQTADQVLSTVARLGGIGRNVPFYDPLAFRAVTQVRYGTSGRNILRGPGVVNSDMAVFRTFPITERLKLQFRAEGFNITNTPHFNNPGASVSNMQLAADGATITNLGNFMSVTGAQADERTFRFTLRLSF